ncbi:uncharacterized protein LOC131063185 [Cryptomeria japonica]|uniref:uncharacterized protein LOC131063185 n=1 Tax=Cryptomeria japonica TaxID=3369 RepID=UPI0025AB9D83|nr:uncharacterized protein LOC131063185 [Cryptomeria japonica]
MVRTWSVGCLFLAYFPSTLSVSVIQIKIYKWIEKFSGFFLCSKVKVEPRIQISRLFTKLNSRRGYSYARISHHQTIEMWRICSAVTSAIVAAYSFATKKSLDEWCDSKS